MFGSSYGPFLKGFVTFSLLIGAVLFSRSHASLFFLFPSNLFHLCLYLPLPLHFIPVFRILLLLLSISLSKICYSVHQGELKMLLCVVLLFDLYRKSTSGIDGSWKKLYVTYVSIQRRGYRIYEGNRQSSGRGIH